MDVSLQRAQGVDLRFVAPPSKSYTHRALVIAALARGESEIVHYLSADDIFLTMDALSAFGVGMTRDERCIRLAGSKGNLRCEPSCVIDLGNSGTSLRLLASVALLCRHPVTLTGSERMRERPVGALVDTLNHLGAEITCTGEEGFPPLRVAGSLRGGKAAIDASVSSQFISSVLISAPYAEIPVELNVHGMVASRSYLDITAAVMEAFGCRIERDGDTWFRVEPDCYKGRLYHIEGDYSSASYFFALAAVCGGRVAVENLNPRSLQGDRRFLIALEQMGCRIRMGDNAVAVESNGQIHGIDIDMASSPDTVQTLGAVAAFADSPTTISGIAHLRHKESDRIDAVASSLRACGVRVEESPGSITIHPSTVRGGVIDPRSDHRTAMAGAVLGLGAGNVTVRSAECVTKSFPGFWESLREAGLWTESS